MRNITIFNILLCFFCVFSAHAADDITIAEVADAQAASADGIVSMSGEIDTFVEHNSLTQTAGYVYSMQTDENNNKKMMIKTKGVFTMQFLVDTADMSVTYLMADGSTKKVTISAEAQNEITGMLGLGSLANNGIYAAINKGSRKDAGYNKRIDSAEYEDSSVKVRVKRKNRLFGGRYAEAEFYDKKAADMRIRLDERIAQAKLGKAEKAGAKAMKKRFINEMEKSRDRIIDITIVKRVESINMDTGMTEETEFFNGRGAKIGAMRVKKKMRAVFKRAGRGKAASEASERVTELPEEAEVEMEGLEGKSRTKIMYKNTRVNEKPDFEWIKPQGMKK